MKVKKTVLARLNKCYAIAPLFYQGKRHFLVASEKADPCCLFDESGMLKDTLWTGPGGVILKTPSSAATRPDGTPPRVQRV